MTQGGSVLEIAYGCGDDLPQYAALHLESGFFRMNYGPGSGWGTSVILPPSLWTEGVLHQGAPVRAGWQAEGEGLVLRLEGTIAGLSFETDVRLSPPRADSMSALVAVRTAGEVALDSRPGEAFKPVMLSSMHISPDLWDAQAAFVDAETLPIPDGGWVADPPVMGTLFGLLGGTSSWKVNAPTVEIRLLEGRAVTGWVTPSVDPNDDNVGLWAAADEVVPAWSYVIAVRP